MATKYTWVVRPQSPYFADFVGDDNILYGAVVQATDGTIEATAFNAQWQRQYDRATSINDARLWVQKQYNRPGTIITV